MVETLLLDQLPDGVTSREYTVLAAACGLTRDANKARKFWNLAVAAAPKHSVTFCFSARGLALFDFDLRNDPESGRTRFQQAIDSISDGTDTAHELAADTYIVWIRALHRYNPASPDLNELRVKLGEELAAIQHWGRRAEIEARMGALLSVLDISEGTRQSKPQPGSDSAVNSDS